VSPRGVPIAAGALHDFKNLLTVIRGHSELLLARLPEGDPLWRSVDAIRKAAASGSALTSHLLAASRRDAAPSAELDLNELVASVVAMLDGAMGPSIALEVRADPAAGRARIARAEMEQVLVNLAMNARDAMPDGGRLTIETRAVTVNPGRARRMSDRSPGAWTEIAVTDTGRGIEPEIAARLFEPYFTTKAGSGTGLGLATARAIARRHGGSIAVETIPGAGSTFRVSLPRLPEAPMHSEPAITPSPEGTETVLLVEDEGELRELVREILELHGYTVLAARTADEAAAVAAAHSGAIHLVITDVFTPGMGPRELLSVLRRCRPDIKVLYVSGHADDEIARRAGPLAGALLRKPFAVSALARTVRDVLDQG
jgi:CheY-like chemotaxis protein